jgi:hypothetical protein
LRSKENCTFEHSVSEVRITAFLYIYFSFPGCPALRVVSFPLSRIMSNNFTYCIGRRQSIITYQKSQWFDRERNILAS